MTKEEIIKALRDMARYPTVTLPRDSEALKVAADLLAQPEQKPIEKNMTLACPSYLHDYTTPPQRTWVGLTEAQCGVLWKTNMTPFEYYQAIEAKLRSKNENR